MSSKEAIGDRIARLRRDQTPSEPQYKLAERIGIHPSSLNQIEKGKRQPKTKTITALAKALGVSRDLLLDGTDAASHEATEAAELSPVISQAIQAAIRETFIDIVNAVSSAIAATGAEAIDQRESTRSKTATKRTGRA